MGTKSRLVCRSKPELELGELESIVDEHDELAVEDQAGREPIAGNGSDVGECGGDVMSTT